MEETLQVRIKAIADKLNISLNDSANLHRVARRLRERLVERCNGCTREKLPAESWAAYDNDRHDRQIPSIERAISRAERKIFDLCQAGNIYFYIQKDPRGPSLYVSREQFSDTNYATAAEAIF